MSAGVACMWSAWAPGVRRCCWRRASAVPPQLDGVLPRVGRTTRSCANDRAGLGGSDPIPGVHDAGDEIKDLARCSTAP